MGSMIMNEIKKQASSFLQEKYKTARLALTDVTQAELLTEEATNSDPSGPDAKTMARISEAAHDVDDYWRIVDIIHRRLHSVNYREWRQAYKTLVLLEFLLTHGPEDMFEEFHCDVQVIRELGKLNYVDERGFNWGACMKQKSQRLVNLLTDEALLAESRSKALKITKEIEGFGNLMVSPSSSSSYSSKTSRTSSFGSYSSNSPTWSAQEDPNKQHHHPKAANKLFEDSQHGSPNALHKEAERLHLWDDPIEENGSLIKSTNENGEETSSIGWSRRFRTRLFGNTNEVVDFRSLSDVGKEKKKKIDRQLSLGL